MSKIIDRTGKGSALNTAEFDANYDSLSGINEAVTGTTYTVTIDDQNRTLEFSNASPIAVTLTAIATIAAALHTSDFKVVLKNIGAGLVTVTRGSTDTFDDGSTSIELEQGEYATIHTDSTGAIWNIISDNRDVVTEAATQTLTNKTLTSPVLNTGVSGTAVLDEDDMASDSATQVATQQSIKAYVDNTIAAIDAYPAFSAYRSANYSYTALNDIIFNTEAYDITSDYDTGTGRFTPSVAGKYRVIAAASNGTPGSSDSLIYIYKNGTRAATGPAPYIGAAYGLVVRDLIMNGTTDYVTARHLVGGTINGGAEVTYFSASRIQE